MMAAESICDGCGKRAPMEPRHFGWCKPHNWFERMDKDGTVQTACCRECIDIIAKKTGKTNVVLPI